MKKTLKAEHLDYCRSDVCKAVLVGRLDLELLILVVDDPFTTKLAKMRLNITARKMPMR